MKNQFDKTRRRIWEGVWGEKSGKIFNDIVILKN